MIRYVDLAPEKPAPAPPAAKGRPDKGARLKAAQKAVAEPKPARAPKAKGKRTAAPAKKKAKS